jgi:hypothetical protein
MQEAIATSTCKNTFWIEMIERRRAHRRRSSRPWPFRVLPDLVFRVTIRHQLNHTAACVSCRDKLLVLYAYLHTVPYTEEVRSFTDLLHASLVQTLVLPRIANYLAVVPKHLLFDDALLQQWLADPRQQRDLEPAHRQMSAFFGICDECRQAHVLNTGKMRDELIACLRERGTSLAWLLESQTDATSDVFMRTMKQPDYTAVAARKRPTVHSSPPSHVILHGMPLHCEAYQAKSKHRTQRSTPPKPPAREEEKAFVDPFVDRDMYGLSFWAGAPGGRWL